MRIGLVIERMDVARGGRETSKAQMAIALTAAGHAVTIVCQSGQAPPGVALHATGVKGISRSARLAYFARAVRPLAAEFDILHTTLPLPGANVYQLRGGTLPGQTAAAVRRRGSLLGPVLARLGQLNGHRRRLMRYEKQLMADERVLLLPVSQVVADEIARHYSRTKNVRVVFNAVEPPAVDTAKRLEYRADFRKRLGATDDDMVFLVVAKNFAIKGVAQTIEAFAQWHEKRPTTGDRLVIVGRDRVEVEGYARHASLRNVGLLTHFIGHESNIAPWYCAADANVLLSWHDSCSRVVLEAACLGLPSITTAYNGASEVLQDGAGIVVPSPADRRAVVEAMVRIADGPTRQAMSAKCIELIPYLSMSRHVKELLAAYEQIL